MVASRDDDGFQVNAATARFVQMSESPPPIVVDARGHRCPVPTLRLRRALEGAALGQVVRLLADDPLARIDVPHFVASQGHRLLSTAVEGEVMAFEVVRD